MSNYFVFGLAGTGKDTFAELMDKHMDTFSIALADEIRNEYVKFLGRNDYKQNRSKMIQIGEGYKQLYGGDVWCRAAEYALPWSDGCLIKDGRYEHEYHYFVTERDYIPVRLYCDDNIRFERLKKRDGTIQQEALEFEKAMFIPDGFDAINICTDGSVSDLEKIVRELIVNESNQD